MNYLYQFGPYSVDSRRRTLSRHGLPVPVTPKAFDLLLYFVQNPDRVISKDELLKAVWADSFVEEGNLTQNVFLLRKALAQKSEDSGLIVTIPRKGYQFTGEVVITSLAAHPSEAPAAQFAGTAVSTAIKKKSQPENHEIRTISSSDIAKSPTPSPTFKSRRRLLAALVSVSAVILVVAGYHVRKRFRTAPTASSRRIMLAVLPLQNLTGDPEQEYFADGFTEELIAQLGRLQPEQLGVIART